MNKDETLNLVFDVMVFTLMEALCMFLIFGGYNGY